MAVHVSDFDGARSAAQGANGIARRRAGVRPVAEGAVSYPPRFLAPVSPALPGGYSPSSSESSSSRSLSSSSESPSSPFRMSSASPTAAARSSRVLSGVYVRLVQHRCGVVNLFLPFAFRCHPFFPFLSFRIADEIKPPVFGVLLDAHLIELIGAVVFTDALHEGCGLSFLAFGLFAGDLLRHGDSIGQVVAVKSGGGECRETQMDN